MFMYQYPGGHAQSEKIVSDNYYNMTKQLSKYSSTVLVLISLVDIVYFWKLWAMILSGCTFSTVSSCQ